MNDLISVHGKFYPRSKVVRAIQQHEEWADHMETLANKLDNNSLRERAMQTRRIANGLKGHLSTVKETVNA
jgi:hypothetical protein